VQAVWEVASRPVTSSSTMSSMDKSCANVVLISTYELGHQPFGLASPAAWLRARNALVVSMDLSREPLREEPIRDADLIAFYVPMHTATRLAIQLIDVVRELNPRAQLCFYGLYAPVNEAYLRKRGVHRILGGEFEAGLAQWVEEFVQTSDAAHASHALGAHPEIEGRHREALAENTLTTPAGTLIASTAQLTAPGFGTDTAALPPDARAVISLERLDFIVPDRTGLPALHEYAHLMLPNGGHLVAGYTEASRGCKHLCRHCPIVPVYNGIFRVVSREVVLADIRQQVRAGAEHISFGDPDFFNGPAHGLAIVQQLHREFPSLSYDVTIKIEHLLSQGKHLTTLRDTGCLFVTTAVESVDDAILERLAKGHTRADFLAVVAQFRELGLVLQPTFVPFTPWTTFDGYRALLELLAEQDLVENIAPIQLGIRLLVPAGSRLLELADMREHLGEFDDASLYHTWRHPDARLDALAIRVQELVVVGDKLKWSRSETFSRIWQAAAQAATERPGFESASWHMPVMNSRPAIPHFTEPWYCCAEPTQEQFISIAGASRPQSSLPMAPERPGTQSTQLHVRPDAFL